MTIRNSICSAGAIALTLAMGGTSQATAIRGDAGFTTSVLPANDDGYTGSVPLGFTIDFFGSAYSSAFVNNNGNITFDTPLGTYTPFDLLSTATPIIAPFFGDVDTRAGGSAEVTYGTSTVNGLAAFGVNWVDVGYYSTAADLLNSFQLVMIDRSDIAAGDFDFEFNYDRIQWETGSASGGTNGLGGSSARAGWSNGVSASYELAGSAVNGALLDGGPDSLVAGSLNSGVDGRYVFSVRNGVVEPPEPPTSVPDGGSTVLCLGLALTGIGGLRRLLRRG